MSNPVSFCSTVPDHCLPRACDPWHLMGENAQAAQAWIQARNLVPWGDLRLFAWLGVLALPFAAWVVATLSVPKGKGRVRLAAAAFGPAAAALAVLMLALEGLAHLPVRQGLFVGDGAFVQLLRGASMEVPAQHGMPACIAPPVAPAEAVLGFAALWGLVLLALVPLVAQRVARRTQALYIHGATPATIALGLAALAVPTLLAPSLDLASFQADLLDWAGGLPILCTALAIFSQARRERAPEPPAPPAPPPPDPRVVSIDAAAIWKHIQALPQTASPFFGTPAGEEPPAAKELEQVWRAAGGTRSPPEALDGIVRMLATEHGGAYLADLPRATEDTLIAAAVLHATAIAGTTCLVLVDDVTRDAQGRLSSALRDRVRRAFAQGGYWDPGPLPLGYAELVATLTGARLPAVCFVGIDELSESVISTLWGLTTPNGLVWARHLDLVVVPRVDQGLPLSVGHRFWSLRRLCLALRAAGATWRVVTTGYGGEASFLLASNAFSGYVALERVEVRPRSADATDVWWVDEEWARQAPEAWPIPAAEPLAAGGLEVGIEDPLGSVDDTTVRARAKGITVSRAVTYAGAATIAALEGFWVFAAIRMLAQRMPHPQSAHHDVLVSIARSPTTRFALAPVNLRPLFEQRRLLEPVPMVARSNIVIQEFHLQAALAEGEQDIESLHAVFDDGEMVDRACGPLFRGNYALRGSTRERAFHRVPLVARSGATVPSHLRETVSDDTMKLVEFDSGEPIAVTDAATARTRYYPGRVFVKGAHRYEVPAGEPPLRDVLRVSRVAPTRPLTRSRLAIAFPTPGVVELREDVEFSLDRLDPQGAKARVHYARLRARVHESVHGITADNGAMISRHPTPARSEYDTRVVFLGFRSGRTTSNVLLHLADAVDDVLRHSMLCDREDLAVVPTDGSELVAPAIPGLIVVDRHLESAGVADALTKDRLFNLLLWVHNVLDKCICSDGCEKCTSLRVLEAGADKRGVLALLTGEST